MSVWLNELGQRLVRANQVLIDAVHLIYGYRSVCRFRFPIRVHRILS
jgi:hypothetical protein